MTDNNEGRPLSQQVPPSDQNLSSEPKHSQIPTWVWVVGAAVAAVLLLGLFATQTPQGRMWLLGLRGQVTVPSVMGQTQSQAQTTLEAAGLRLGQVSEVATLAVAPGAVAGQAPPAGGTAAKDSAVDIAVATIPTVKIPDVVGETQSDAITLLAEAGLRADQITYVYDSKVQAGDVTAQQPGASEEASVGSAVDLTVSKGAKQGQVPNVVGLSQDDADAVITAAGFKVTTVKTTSTSVPAGDVAAQSPAAGVVVAAGSTVTITVSTGAPAPAPAPEPTPEPTPTTTPEPTSPPEQSAPAATSTPEPPSKPSEPVAQTVEVPNVIGSTVLEAVRTLRDAKLKVAFEFAPSDADFLKVTAQDPGSGTSVDLGTTVTITISLPSISLPDGKPTQPVPAPQPVQLPATPTAEPATPGASVTATP